MPLSCHPTPRPGIYADRPPLLTRDFDHGKAGARRRVQHRDGHVPTALRHRLPDHAAEQLVAVMAQFVMLSVAHRQRQRFVQHVLRRRQRGNVQDRRLFAAQPGKAFAEHREIVRADAHRQAEGVHRFAQHVA